MANEAKYMASYKKIEEKAFVGVFVPARLKKMLIKEIEKRELSITEFMVWLLKKELESKR